MKFGTSISSLQPQQESSPTTQNSSIFWMQRDMNLGNTTIIHYLGPENRQNLTQKDTNFGNAIILHHLGPENRQNPTQKDTNFGNAIILHYLGPENYQNPTQKDTNFEKLHSLTPAKSANK